MNNANLLLVATVLLPLATLSQVELSLQDQETRLTSAIHSEAFELNGRHAIEAIDLKVRNLIIEYERASALLCRSRRLGRLYAEDRLKQFERLSCQRQLDRYIAIVDSLPPEFSGVAKMRMKTLSRRLEFLDDWPEVFEAALRGENPGR